ncbi:hypothetical protein ATEIFO6365_0004046300 [Aspergillus terreus]|uniref:Uncharacterized protein n=1 Tax=Aspergillus terreus TaxID=33178 RepID=A0A5M3YT87_ASPTE|nr:hypothetical protein ATETN484_0002048800 [Aspergillus terreus]GFF15344.1 hypothetical protein ATEIFO6365_0004046300 [Aspergillus terreus]
MTRSRRPGNQKPNLSSAKKVSVDGPEVEHLETAPDTQDLVQNDSDSIGTTRWNNSDRSKTRRPNSYTPGLHQLSRSRRYSHPGTASNDSYLRSPTQLPEKPQPAMSTSQLRSQSFVDAPSRDVKRPPILGAGHMSSTKTRYPDHIGFSYLSKPPRWVIMPVTKRKPGDPDQPLQWVFDSGEAIGSSELRQSEVYKIGYKYLQDAYADPVFRNNVRSEIRTGPFALKVADVEDPLPLLPPPPPGHKYAPPAGTHSTVEYFRGYERPVLATRPGQYAPETGSPSPTSDGYSATLSDGFSTNTFDRAKSLDTRYSGSSDLEDQRSQTGTHPRYDEGADDGPILHAGEYKWLWFLVTFLVLGMFLCLFLYAFKVIR